MMKNNNPKLQPLIFVFTIFIFLLFIFNFHLPFASADIMTGLVSHWKLDETSGAIASDSNGTNNGTLTNGPTWTTGKINNGLNFDGTNDYVNTNANLGITGEMTVSTWVNPAQAPNGTGRIAATTYYYSRGGTNQRGWTLGYDYGSSDVFGFRIYDSSGNLGNAQKSNFFSDNLNKWTHIVGVYKPSTYLKLFVNGSLVSEDTTSVPANIGYKSGINLRIGARADFATQGLWKGKIDDVRVYNRALSSTDISELYNYTGTQSSSSSSINLEPPKNLGVELLCDPTVNLFWTAPNGQVQSYNIENIGVWGPTNTTNTDYADSAVAKDTYYIYDVTAVYGQGESAPASILVKTPSDQECQETDELIQNCPYSSNEANYKYALTFSDNLHKKNVSGSIIPTTMSAGSYRVSLASFDGVSVNRKSQPNEQWYISLKNSSGNEIAKTASSTDLEDNVAYAYKQEVVNESLAVSNDVANVQAMWGGGWYAGSWGSVWGICGYFEKIDPATGLPYGSPSGEVSIDSFTATPNPVDIGSTTVLSWTSSNADYCTASGGWSGLKSFFGSTTTLPIYGTTTFALKCVSADRTSEALASVIVDINSSENEIESVNCQPSPQIANIGQDITWTANPEPPSGSYTYSWSGDDNLSGSSQTVTKSYSTTGTKTGIVDIGGATNPQQCTGTVRITASPSFDEF